MKLTKTEVVRRLRLIEKHMLDEGDKQAIRVAISAVESQVEDLPGKGFQTTAGGDKSP